MSSDFGNLINRVDEATFSIVGTKELMKMAKDDCPIYGHTAGDSPHNWEELQFRGYKLRLSDICTEAHITYYCDVPSEFTYTLELTDPSGKTECISRVITNMKDPSAEGKEYYPEKLQPWLDVLLKDALGLPPTQETWAALASHLRLASFSAKPPV